MIFVRYPSGAERRFPDGVAVAEAAADPAFPRTELPTVAALAGGEVVALSDRLWTAHGLRTDSRRRTVWDRSTLFALRGAFAAGAVEEGWRRLRDYAGRRLLGSHVPYPAEAFPELGHRIGTARVTKPQADLERLPDGNRVGRARAKALVHRITV